VWVKEGNLTAPWTKKWATTATEVAVASDPRHGPLIAVLDGSGNVWATEGSLTAPWTEEYDSAATSMAAEYSGIVIPAETVAVASDPRHGPLIVLLDGSGNVWAKDGGLTAAWTKEYSGLTVSATPVAVASDPANGPVIGVAEAAA
jgi:hypothetical protein